MNKKIKDGQKMHDKAVLKIIDQYKGLKNKITADLPKFKKPQKINGFIPDVVVKNGQKRIVIEAETKESNNTDKKQLEAFKSCAGNKTIFKKKIIKNKFK